MLSGNERIFLESFFSVREFGILQRFDLIPMQNDGDTFALLLVAYPDDEQEPIEGVDQFVSSVEDHMYRCYTEKIGRLPPLPAEPEADSLTAVYSAVRRDGVKGPLLVCSVELDGLKSAVEPKSSNIDHFKFEQDLTRILHSFIGASGFLYRADGRKLLLGLPLGSVRDGNFYLYHAVQSLGDFFPGKVIDPALFTSPEVVTDENSDELLAKFL